MLKRRPLLLVSEIFIFRTTAEWGKRKGKAMPVRDVNVCVTEGRENLQARSQVCAAVSGKVSLARTLIPLDGVEQFVAMIIF